MLRAFFLLSLTVLLLQAAHINVGYSTDSFNELTKKDSRIVLDLWFKKMVADSPHTASMVFYDDITLLSEDFSSRKLDLVFANGMEFVKYFDMSKLESGFSGGAMDERDDNLVVIVKKSTTAQILKKKSSLRIAHIKGKNPAQLYAKYMMLKEYKNKEVSYIYTKKHSASLLKVFFNQVDIAIVSKKTFKFAKELNPQIGYKLKIMKETDITITSLGYYHKDVDEDLRNEIMKLAFEETHNEKGKQMMVMFKIDKLVKIDKKRLEPIKKLYKEYLELVGEL